MGRDLSPVCSEAECGVIEYNNIEPRQGRHLPYNAFEMSFKTCIAPAGALLLFKRLTPHFASLHTGLRPIPTAVGKIEPNLGGDFREENYPFLGYLFHPTSDPFHFIA